MKGKSQSGISRPNAEIIEYSDGKKEVLLFVLLHFQDMIVFNFTVDYCAYIGRFSGRTFDPDAVIKISQEWIERHMRERYDYRCLLVILVFSHPKLQ